VDAFLKGPNAVRAGWNQKSRRSYSETPALDGSTIGAFPTLSGVALPQTFWPASAALYAAPPAPIRVLACDAADADPPHRF